MLQRIVNEVKLNKYNKHLRCCMCSVRIHERISGEKVVWQKKSLCFICLLNKRNMQGQQGFIFCNAHYAYTVKYI